MKMKKKREEIIKLLKNNDLVKLSSAIEIYKKKYPKDFFGWNMDGLLNEKSMNLEIALERFLKSEKLNPELVLIKINLSRVFFKLDQKKSCKEKLKEILILDKKNHYAVNFLSSIYFDEKKYSKVINILSKVIDIFENDVSLLKKLAISYFSLADFLNSKVLFEKLIKIQPDLHSHYLDLGVSFYYLKNFNLALVNFAKAISIKYDHKSMLNFNKVIKDEKIKYDDFPNEIDVYNSNLRDSVSLKF